MRVSETIREFVDLLNAYARDSLREREQLALLLQAAHESSMHDQIGRIAFHGKYLARLHQTLLRETQAGEHAETLQKEFGTAIQQFRDLLVPFLPVVTPEERQTLESEFLAMNQGAIRRLLSLSRDFMHLKNWEREFEEREGAGKSDTDEPA